MTGDRAVTKDEIDVEKHFLGQTVRLSDGTEGLVFSRGQRNAHQFIYNCHLCGVANLPGERCLQTHISGRKHQTKLQQPIIDAISFRAPLVQKPKIQMNIAPGEPVPPGFEDEVRPMAQIQNILNKYKETALIGIEYCVELNINDDRELGYICLLCDKRGNSKTIISHWASYNHRLKYLEKHYPMVIKELVPVRYNPEARNIMPKIIESVCEAIEDHHGRLMPVVCDNNDFKRKRNAIYQEIIADKHFDEKCGPNFINSINKNLIDELKGDKNRDPSPPSVKAPKRKPGMSGFDKILLAKRKDRNSLDSISSDSSTSLNDLQLNRNRTRSRSNDRLGGNSNKLVKRKKSQSPAFRILPRVQRSPPFGELHDIKIDKKKNSLPTPKELSLQASEIAQERYKWEKYRCMLEIATQDLEKSLKNFEKNPEKHPLYPEEWKQFWNRRYKELQAEKKDPNKYDFKPEWVIFWTKRMKELHDDEIEKKKKELRKRLMLPDDAEERTNELKEQYKIKTTTTAVNKLSTIQKSQQSQKTNNSSSVRDKTKSSAAVIDISDDEDLLDRPSKSSSKRSAGKSRSFSRSLSPISDDNDRRRKQSRYSRERDRSRDYSREREREYRRSRSRDREIERLRGRERERERYPVLGIPPSGEYFHRGPRMILAPGSHPLGHPFVPRGYYPPPHQQPPNPYSFRSMDSYNYPKYDPDAKPKESKEPQDDGPLTVVAVLRLLTALEEPLGSLGPKVVDLLSKALALEKVKANSADDMLTNDDHCVFFETVKEKLKGQLIADVLDANKVKTVKRAIKNIAAIIHQVSEKQNSAANTKPSDDDKKTEEDKNEENGKNNSKKIGNKELPFDRQLISSKLAAALVMQERTDITKDEMDKLIYVFILMVKLSKERETTVSVQDMLIELGIISPPQQVTENIVEEEYIEDDIPPDILESIGDGQHQANSNDAFEDVADIIKVGDQHEDEEDDGNQQSGVGDLESLTDSDLQTLLQNFKHLSSEEQHHLISHLKKLESTNPLRVEKLRKFVNIADLKNEADKSKTDKNNVTNIKMKITNSANNNNNNNKKPSPKKHINIFSDDDYDDDDDDSKLQKMIDSEDEDDDYNFDDVVKAASKNINRHNIDEDNLSHRSNHSHRIDSINRENIGDISNMSKASSSLASTSTANLGMSLADTQNLIANLMGSLQKSTGQFVNSSENNSNTNNNNTPNDVNNSGMKKTIPTLVNAGKTKNHSNVTAPYYQQQNDQVQQQQQPNLQIHLQQQMQQQQQQAMPVDYQQQMVQGQQFGYNNMYYQNYNMPQDYNSQTNAMNYNYNYAAQNSQSQQPYNFQNFQGQSNYILPQQQQPRK